LLPKSAKSANPLAGLLGAGGPPNGSVSKLAKASVGVFATGGEGLGGPNLPGG